MKKQALLIVCLLATIMGYAYDFKVDGIYYGINNDGKTVYVTSGNVKYSGEVVIPSTVTYDGTTYSVTSIGYEAFLGCSGLTSVTIPESVSEIGGYAFSGCSGLTSVTIPESVTKIGDLAFQGCSGLTSVVYNAKNCTSMGSSSYPAFSGCKNLTALTIGENVQTIPSYAFSGCSRLTSVTIPESVTSIGEDAFYGCNGLAKVEISDIAAWCNIEFGNDYANPLYYAHNLYLNGVIVRHLFIPESVTEIGDWAFSGCSGLTTVAIPESVTSIGEKAFQGCSGLAKVEISDIAAWCNIEFGSDDANPLSYAHNLYLNRVLVKNLVIPESVTSIGKYAFSGCNGLTSVTIPESATEIGDYAFKGCTDLMSFTSLNVMPPTLPGETTFEGMSGSCQLYVPESSVIAYQTSMGWTFFTFVNGMPDSGVDAIETDTLTVTVEGGAIRVDGAEGAVIEVYSLGGMLLYRGTETTIAMQSGAYLVKVAGTTQKVVL